MSVLLPIRGPSPGQNHDPSHGPSRDPSPYRIRIPGLRQDSYSPEQSSRRSSQRLGRSWGPFLAVLFHHQMAWYVPPKLFAAVATIRLIGSVQTTYCHALFPDHGCLVPVRQKALDGDGGKSRSWVPRAGLEPRGFRMAQDLGPSMVLVRSDLFRHHLACSYLPV